MIAGRPALLADRRHGKLRIHLGGAEGETELLCHVQANVVRNLRLHVRLVETRHIVLGMLDILVERDAARLGPDGGIDEEVDDPFAIIVVGRERTAQRRAPLVSIIVQSKHYCFSLSAVPHEQSDGNNTPT